MAKAEAQKEDPAAVAARRQVEQQQERQKRVRERAQLGGLWSRRDVFGRFGWSIFGAFGGISLLAAVRSAFPRVLFAPPSAFKAGKPSDYAIGEVDERWKDKYGIWLVRTEEVMYALITVCTHLGCTPNWLPTQNKFKCPCHGSGYYKSGINFEGPTPRPLERAKIFIDTADGQIVVDKSKQFHQERGEWTDPESFIKV